MLCYYLLDNGQCKSQTATYHELEGEDTRSVGRGGNLPHRSPPPRTLVQTTPPTTATALCRSPLPVSFRRPLWRPWLIVSGSRQFAAQSVARSLPIHHITSRRSRYVSLWPSSHDRPSMKMWRDYLIVETSDSACEQKIIARTHCSWVQEVAVCVTSCLPSTNASEALEEFISHDFVLKFKIVFRRLSRRYSWKEKNTSLS